MSIIRFFLKTSTTSKYNPKKPMPKNWQIINQRKDATDVFGVLVVDAAVIVAALVVLGTPDADLDCIACSAPLVAAQV